MVVRLALLVFAVSGCLGGPVTPAPTCVAYVACIQALDAQASTTTNLDRFVAGGACWTNGEIAELCATGCERGLARLRERSAALPEACAP